MLRMNLFISLTISGSGRGSDVADANIRLVDPVPEKILTSNPDQTNHAATKEDNNEVRCTRQKFSFSAPVVTKPSRQTSVLSPAHSRVLAFVAHEVGTNLHSDLVHAPMHHSTPNILRKIIQSHSDFTTSRLVMFLLLPCPMSNSNRRKVRVRSRSHAAKVPVGRETPRHLAAPKKSTRQPQADLPPLGKKICAQPFPEQNSAHQLRLNSIYPLRQSVELSANPPSTANSANDGRRRASTPAPPPLFTGARHPDTPEYRANSVMNNTRQQAMHSVRLAQDEPERHDIKTEISDVPKEQFLVRGESASNNRGHHTAAFVVALVEQQELQPCKNTGHTSVLGEDMEIHRDDVDSTHCVHIPPEHPTQAEIVMGEMGGHNFIQEPQRELSHHFGQSRVQQPGARITNESRGSQELQSILENHFQQFQPPSRAQSRHPNARKTSDQISHPKRQHDDELQSQQPPILPRPDSRRSNIGTPMSCRPLRPEDLEIAHNSTPAMGVQNAQRVQKSSSSQDGTLTEKVARMREKARASEIEAQQSRQQVLELQLEQMEVERKKEMAKLHDANTETKKTIVQLQTEKFEQEQRLARFKKLSTKYEKHINGVVRMQDFLKGENGQIKARMTNVAAEAKQVVSLIATREKQEKAVGKCREKKDKLRM